MAEWKTEWLEIFQRKHLDREALLSTQAAVGRGMLDLHKEAMQHANRKGGVSAPGQVIEV